MKKIITIVSVVFVSIILVGMYKFNNLASKESHGIERNNDLCDADGNRYKGIEEAEKAGLKAYEFGATFCPEYKMHPSWDVNKDGINDCYESNSCSKKIDYMSPRDEF